MKKYTLLAALLFIFKIGFSQTAPPSDIVTIEQNLKKLNVLGSVLYVAAHPDDENTRLLAYLAQEKHYRTGYLSMTRGDGGQNLIGNEQSELLGLIRTQELLAARRVDGAEQFFTRANDFGFSKGPDETLKIWDKEKILSDVVWVIRKFRPDVIICRFPTTGEGGHGHHTSSAILAQEAFAAAADPKRFPEQLQYVQVWQAKRLLWNTFNFGSTNTTAPNQFKINVGIYNPLLGKGYGEIAAESRSNHKTQGFGSARQRGNTYEYFKTILGDAPQTDLMDGVNTTWDRVKNGAEIGNTINAIRKSFDTEHSDKSVSALVQLSNSIEKINDTYWHKQKTKELNELIAACAGLWFESYTTEPVSAIRDSINIRVQAVSRYNDNIKLSEINNTQLNNGGMVIPTNELQTIDKKIYADKITQPYWLEYAHNIGSYNVDYLDKPKAVEQKTLPENIPLSTQITFTILGKQISFERAIQYKYVNPARGELYDPLIIAPPVTANIQNKVYIFNSQQAQTIQVKLKSFKNGSTGNIQLNVPKNWKVNPASVAFSNKAKGDEWEENFIVTPIGNQSQTVELVAQITLNNDQTAYNYGITTLHYDHVPNITLFPKAGAKLVQLDLKLAGKKIGYINGAGDLVQDALKQVGYDVHTLTESEILNSDLSNYDAIVVGVRAYNVDTRLAVEQPKLLDYVKNGGNLLIQYNNSSGLVTKQIGPYPFKVVNERVTDENAVITILDANNAVLNYPNKITQADFEGWVQERGLYFTKDADAQYQKVLRMNDPNEAPKDGALITTSYGKGRFIYTSLSFFRQLPAGVLGAYRLFVNLLSKP